MSGVDGGGAGGRRPGRGSRAARQRRVWWCERHLQAPGARVAGRLELVQALGEQLGAVLRHVGLQSREGEGGRQCKRGGWQGESGGRSRQRAARRGSRAQQARQAQREHFTSLTASSGSSLCASPFSLLLALMSRLRREGRPPGRGRPSCRGVGVEEGGERRRAAAGEQGCRLRARHGVRAGGEQGKAALRPPHLAAAGAAAAARRRGPGAAAALGAAARAHHHAEALQGRGRKRGEEGDERLLSGKNGAAVRSEEASGREPEKSSARRVKRSP